MGSGLESPVGGRRVRPPRRRMRPGHPHRGGAPRTRRGLAVVSRSGSRADAASSHTKTPAAAERERAAVSARGGPIRGVALYTGSKGRHLYFRPDDACQKGPSACAATCEQLDDGVRHRHRVHQHMKMAGLDGAACPTPVSRVRVRTARTRHSTAGNNTAHPAMPETPAWPRQKRRAAGDGPQPAGASGVPGRA